MASIAADYPYYSRRMSVYSGNGMVASSHMLATQTGLEILREGGNAMDAAVAAAAVLTVVKPTENGIGGDAFALIWANGQMHGLNASGPSPMEISANKILDSGHRTIPKLGWLPVTVPGTPAAWAEIHSKFGRLPFSKILEPAIRYAEHGHAVSPVTHKYWDLSLRNFQSLKGRVEFEGWFQTFAPSGRAPAVGEIWQAPYHAKTLRAIAASHARAFYEGDIADIIGSFSERTGGYLRKKDLEVFSPQWVQPIKTNYRGYDVWELPPNCQGIVALMALNILKGFEFDNRDDVLTYHRQIEAMKLAFADGFAYITDPAKMQVHIDDLLSDSYASHRRIQIGDTAVHPCAGVPSTGGTVYVAAADNEGNMVSYIQSNFVGFGSGIVIPGTGVALQNRGHTFSLDKHHVNYLEPGKLTYHTIIPGFLTKNSSPIGPFGMVGGYNQPQGHVQIVMNTVDFGLTPQAVLDAPRWRWIEGRKVLLERQVPELLAIGLADKGHDVEVAYDSDGFGRGQVVFRQDSGGYAGGTDSRTDGFVAGW